MLIGQFPLHFAEASSYYSTFFNKEGDLDIQKKPVMLKTALVLYVIV
jgi:hypothetical protein